MTALNGFWLRKFESGGSLRIEQSAGCAVEGSGGLSHLYEPDYGYFLDAGLPEEFIDHASVSPGEHLPIVFLPEDWTPGHEMGVELIRRLAARGIGFYVPPGLPQGFDLAWIRGEIGFVRSLLFTQADTNLRNAELLGQAESAVEVTTPGSGYADLSGLRDLRWLGVSSNGFLTGLSAPNLVTAVVHMQELSSVVPLASTLRHLSLMCERIDILHVFHEAPRLETLGVYECRRLDLRTVPLPAGLSEVLIADCRLLKGTERLSDLSRLNQLKLIRVSRIETARSLLAVRAEKVEIVNCPDIGAEFAREATQRHPAWWVQPSRRAVSRSRFDVQPLEDGGYQVTFEDWEWVRSLLPWDEAVGFGSSEMEQALSRVTDAPGTRPVNYTFDSEGDTLIAIVQTKAAASRLRRSWDRALSDSQSFAAICNSLP